MASEVNIVNLALAHLGEGGTVTSIDPPEGSVQAAFAATFYPIARDALLELYPWNFNTRRITPAALTSQTSSYKYAYQIPSNALRIFSILPPDTTDDYVGQLNTSLALTYQADELSSVVTGKLPQNFAREVLDDKQDIIYTDIENAIVRYSIRLTDPAKFSSLFVLALSRLLAHYLAGPIIKGKRGRDEATKQYQLFLAEVGAAKVVDAEQGQQILNYKAPWMNDR